MDMLTRDDGEFLLAALASGEMFGCGAKVKIATRLVNLGLAFQSYARPDYFWLTARGVDVARNLDRQRRVEAHRGLRGGMEVKT